MNDDQNPADEVGDEVVLSDDSDQSEATENTEGQEQDPPADAEEPEGESADEKVTKSKARRERRKAREAALEEAASKSREKARELEQSLKALKEAGSKAPPPKQDDFDNYDEYISALAAHQSSAVWDSREMARIEGQRNAELERQQRLAQERKADLRESWQSQVEEASARYADFSKVFDESVPVTDMMADMIAQSENGADMAYYLGSNRQEAAQIAQLSQYAPLEAARKLGAIEARLSIPKPRKVTASPDPINPLRGGGTSSKDPAKMNMAEFRAWRDAGGTF